MVRWGSKISGEQRLVNGEEDGGHSSSGNGSYENGNGGRGGDKC